MKLPCRSSRLRAVIFDLDGVLVDSEPLHARTWLEVLRPFGFEADQRWFDRWIGIPDENLAVHLAEQKIIAVSAAEILRRKRRAFQQAVRAGELPLFAGVRRGLEDLFAAGVALAVASNSRGALVRAVLRAVGIIAFFSAIVGVDEVRCGKPAPDIFCEAARRLGIPAGECAAVEDSPAGIAAALAANCRVYGVATTHAEERLAQAHVVVTDTAAAIARLLADYALFAAPERAGKKAAKSRAGR
ncbi:MAG: HAD family phosphatase [Planctomycetota bacterium]|nr:HAD family phosphatase [Planctomycetota bacterium]